MGSSPFMRSKAPPLISPWDRWDHRQSMVKMVQNTPLVDGKSPWKSWIFPKNMVIFCSYVELPEGISFINTVMKYWTVLDHLYFIINSFKKKIRSEQLRQIHPFDRSQPLLALVILRVDRRLVRCKPRLEWWIMVDPVRRTDAICIHLLQWISRSPALHRRCS